MHFKIPLILLIFPALILRADNGNANAKGRARGTKTGDYSVRLSGDFKGSGRLNVTKSTLSVALAVTSLDGRPLNLEFNNLKLINDRFAGTTRSASSTFTLSGRIDLPAATDDQTTDDQAFTGRMVAMIHDDSGRATILVSIQEESSRGKGEAK